MTLPNPSIKDDIPAQVTYEYRWGRIVFAILIVSALGIIFMSDLFKPSAVPAKTTQSATEIASSSRATPNAATPTTIPRMMQAQPIDLKPKPGSVLVTTGQGVTSLDFQVREVTHSQDQTINQTTASTDEANQVATVQMAQLQSSQTASELPSTTSMEPEMPVKPGGDHLAANPPVEEAQPVSPVADSDTQMPPAMAATDTEQFVQSSTDDLLTAPIPSPGTTVHQSAESATVEIFSPLISRARLTLSINEKEPGDPAPSVLTLPEDDLARVFFFTEINNAKGTTLIHRWYRNGKQQARVVIPVHGLNWRSYSSKLLNREMTGEWQVKVFDRKGNLLAESGFVFAAGTP